MGSFSERGVWIEMLRLQPGSNWRSEESEARRLLVVLSGEGSIGDEPVSRLSAVQVEGGEVLELSAESELTIFLVGLPPIETPAVESEEFDLEELPAEEAAA
jgi:redox-sensitive bicupin YhaK (pirin superfamily)